MKAPPLSPVLQLTLRTVRPDELDDTLREEFDLLVMNLYQQGLVANAPETVITDGDSLTPYLDVCLGQPDSEGRQLLTLALRDVHALSPSDLDVLGQFTPCLTGATFSDIPPFVPSKRRDRLEALLVRRYNLDRVTADDVDEVDMFATFVMNPRHDRDVKRDLQIAASGNAEMLVPHLLGAFAEIIAALHDLFPPESFIVKRPVHQATPA